VEEARVRFLGKKGEVTRLFEEFRAMDKENKKLFGKSLNDLKNAVQGKIEELKGTVADDSVSDGPKADLTMPGDPFELGSRHPVSIVRQRDQFTLAE
jgi:phenylalanyl-tRNA synthetase alpha chain